MSRKSPLGRPHLADVSPYVPGKPAAELQRETGIAEITKLASNENPMGPSPHAVDAARSAATDAHRYPDSDAFELRERLAQLHEVDCDELCFGHGSNQLIDMICRAFAGPEQHAVIGRPSFAAYGLSLAVADVPTTTVPLTDGVFWDVDALLSAVRPQTRLIFVDNPNNPTSTHLPASELRRLLAALPGHVVPVIDEAYHHYVEAEDYQSALSLRDRSSRLIVLRTFSKAFGLAALRAGYAVGPPELLAYIDKVRPPFNLNSIAQAAAIAALDDQAHLQRVVAHNRVERARLQRELAELGLIVAPSQANFVFVTLPSEGELDAPALYERLLQHGVITRVVAGPRHLRISVGLREENDRLLVALRRALC